MSRRQKKRVDVKFYHHYLIPLALCFLVILCGIIMIYMDQVGSYSGNNLKHGIGWYHYERTITGKGAIATGLLAASFIGFMYYKTKKDK